MVGIVDVILVWIWSDIADVMYLNNGFNNGTLSALYEKFIQILRWRSPGLAVCILCSDVLSFYKLLENKYFGIS